MRYLLLLPLTLLTGCTALGQFFFPVLPAEYFETPPVPLGPLSPVEQRIELDVGADGEPLGVTVFRPGDLQADAPTLVWVLGVNNRPYYHQSLHETLASYGYVTLIPDTRDINFLDGSYHARNVNNTLFVLQLAISGDLEVNVDPARVALGGYSVGATLAAFAAAQDSRVAGLVFWAPADAPFWLGVTPNTLLPQVTQPALYVLGGRDNVAPANGWPAELQRRMVDSESTVSTIDNGVHLFFQQPGGVDDRNPATSITRLEQQAIAINTTRQYLDQLLYDDQLN